MKFFSEPSTEQKLNQSTYNTMNLALDPNTARALGYLPSAKPLSFFRILWNRAVFKITGFLHVPHVFSPVPERLKTGTDLVEPQLEDYPVSEAELKALQAASKAPIAQADADLDPFSPYRQYLDWTMRREVMQSAQASFDTMPEQMVDNPGMTSRARYAARAIESACFLACGAKSLTVAQTVILRATQMLNMVWETEVKTWRSAALAAPIEVEVEVANQPFTDVNLEPQRIWIKAFWDSVMSLLRPDIVYVCTAYYDQTVNPNGEHNVCIHAQPARAVEKYVFDLKCP